MSDDEGGAGRGPLPPEDRLWRHPSEVARPERHARRGWSWLPLGIGLLIGASAAVTTLWVGGALDDAEGPGVARERLATPVSTVYVGTVGGGLDDLAGTLVTVRAGDLEGGGVVLRDDGHVLTTADLVGTRRHVSVHGVDGVERAGSVVGVDPATDVAVLRIPGLTADGAVLGTSAEVAVGDPARAVNLGEEGAALVLSGTVANLAVTVSRDDDEALHGLLGTDIVRGEPVEGAALVDADGAVIGVTTGVGDTDVLRAVPMDLARVVAHDIIATGGPEHPWLGVLGRDLDDALAAEWGVPGGAEVETVVEGSPAADAGLRDDDVVTNVGDTAITGMGDLVTALRHLDPGDDVRLGYLRDGRHQWCEAVLARPA